MKKKAAIFCHNGLGDAIITGTLSNNFYLNNWEVVTYHNSMHLLKNWIPSYLQTSAYPEKNQIPSILKKYDLLVIFHNISSDFVVELMQLGKEKYPEKIKIFYPFPTKRIQNNLYYQDCLVNPQITILQNILNFSKNILKFSQITKSNGFAPLDSLNLIHEKYPKRVCLHTVSSREGKNWPRKKYVQLALHLKKYGYSPYVIVGGPKDRGDWEEFLKPFDIPIPYFTNLEEVASFIYESGFLIGNDSGLGHLASCLNLPTVTISRRKRVAQFWRPDWEKNIIVNPSNLIPNIRGFRLRDRKWKYFISVRKVLAAFKKLIQR